MEQKSGKDRVLILVKALPHASEKHGETVCCAGITAKKEWRRQFPIPFRYLDDKRFKRWQWIEYEWRKPSGDQRPESQRVQEGSIEVFETIPTKERASFLNSIVTSSVEEAKANGQTLTLVRPINSKFSYRRKSEDMMLQERAAYKAATDQTSFLIRQQKPFDPCPYNFIFNYYTSDGKPHRNVCDDWETTGMFWRLSTMYGEQKALAHMNLVFNEEYPRKGMVFALGTHSSRADQWLLVGVIRLDEDPQLSLLG